VETWKQEIQHAVIHRNGCGGVMFYMEGAATDGEVVTAQTSWFPDGTQPKPGDPFKCGSCGAVLLQQSWIPLQWVTKARL
jgi:hypothetical protein